MASLIIVYYVDIVTGTLKTPCVWGHHQKSILWGTAVMDCALEDPSVVEGAVTVDPEVVKAFSAWSNANWWRKKWHGYIDDRFWGIVIEYWFWGKVIEGFETWLLNIGFEAWLLRGLRYGYWLWVLPYIVHVVSDGFWGFTCSTCTCSIPTNLNWMKFSNLPSSFPCVLCQYRAWWIR